MEQIVEFDRKPQARSELSIVPVTRLVSAARGAEPPTRMKWLRGGREPAVLVMNETGELIYTVHRAIHRESASPR